jgi:cytochrome d ubiquinol oxidase subunit II
MTLAIWVAGALMTALLLFALAGGADFGGGIWTLLARGENAEEQARLVDRAIGPMWEANELWIVVATAILWVGFTDAFVVVGIALYVPLILVLAGILIRGAFFAFQHEAEYLPSQAAFILFGKVYGSVSLVSPFFFGAAAGTIASGRLRFDSAPPDAGRFATGTPADGYLQAWLGLFPLTVGLLAVLTCAYLAAVYLTMEAEEGSPLQELFRRRGIVSGLGLTVLGIVALPIARADAPYLWRGVTQFPGLGFMALAALALLGSLALLYLRRYWWARTAAILEVAAVFAAWGWSQYPYLVVPDITLQSAASPDSILVALLVLSFFYAAILGPSLALLIYIFKRHPSNRKAG